MTKKTFDEESVKKIIITTGVIASGYLVGKTYLQQAMQARGLERVVGLLGTAAMTALATWSTHQVMPDIIDYGFTALHNHVEINVSKEESDED